MTKKAYMKPATNVVKIQQQRVICASQLQNSEVGSAWSRGNDDWDDEDE